MSGQFVGSLAILSALVAIPLLMIIIFGFCERAWEHSERMKALENGRSLPERHGPRPLWQAVLVGAGVPMVGCSVALSMYRYNDNSIWTAIAAISLLAAIPASLAALRIPAPSRAAHSAHFNGKPVFDPDSYETIGR